MRIAFLLISESSKIHQQAFSTAEAKMVSDPLIGITCFDAFANDVDVTVMTDRAQRDQLSGNVSDLNAFWLLGFSNFPSGIRGPQRILANFGWTEKYFLTWNANCNWREREVYLALGLVRQHEERIGIGGTRIVFSCWCWCASIEERKLELEGNANVSRAGTGAPA